MDFKKYLSGKRIAIIGGAGFIGHNLALKLKQNHAIPFIIDGLHLLYYRQLLTKVGIDDTKRIKQTSRLRFFYIIFYIIINTRKINGINKNNNLSFCFLFFTIIISLSESSSGIVSSFVLKKIRTWLINFTLFWSNSYLSRATPGRKINMT